MKRYIFGWAVPVSCLLLLFAAGCEREEQPAEGQQGQVTEQQQEPGTTQQQDADGAQQPQPTGQLDEMETSQAVAKLQPTEGNQASGTVTFEPRDEGIMVVADIEGLEPGKHGLHIHEKGDCSAPDASSAGEHYNPTNTPHGAQSDPPDKRHVGDLGNVEADADGKAHLEMVDPVITLEGENSIIGKAVIVHAQPDDLTSQPTGNAGPRVACGVIETR